MDSKNILTAGLKKRFCRDENIGIQVYAEPYFTERVELLGKGKELTEFIDLINTRYHGSEQEFNEEYNKVKDNIINYIKDSKTFQMLNSDDMNKYSVNRGIRQSDAYKIPNIGKKFISIDMKKANFNSLLYYSKQNNITDDTLFSNSGYEAFIGEFTEVEHFIRSKYIRQVVFGNCNPKRQVTYEKYIMNKVLDELIKSGTVNENMIYSFMNDEIIIDAEELTDTDVKAIKDVVENLSNKMLPLSFEYYVIGKVNGSEAFLKKDLYNGNITPKCLPAYDSVFVHRLLKGETVIENDLIFYSDGRLAKYLETPELSITF